MSTTRDASFPLIVPESQHGHPMKRPTQADVARAAGVSRATVSYVLNRQTKGRVPISSETRERVLAAAAALGYEPDARAQSLRSGATRTIGLLVPDLQNPHFWQIVDSATQAARQAGYDLLLSSGDLDRAQEEASLKSLLRRRVDGLILSVTFTRLAQEMLSQMAARRLPIVMIGGGQFDFDYIGSDYRESTREVVAHLQKLGHRRIAFIHGVASPGRGQDRLQSYQESLQDAGLPFDESLVAHCGPSVQDGYQAGLQLLDRPDRPTAIIVINDLLAMGVLRAAADRGLDVPRELSLVGYDDIPMADYLVPRLTSVHMDAEAIGQGAVELLLQRLRAPEDPRRAIRIPTRLVVRESTGPAPGHAQG